MLSKLIATGLKRQPAPVMVALQSRNFRTDFLNPYLHNPLPLTETERTKQENLPVWERTFDWKKYMEHDGPLKLSTGIAHLDVEPFPRMKLMKLYYLTIEELKDLPDKYGYKFLSQELTRYRMKVVDETRSVRAIEEKVAAGLIEEMIYQAHNELKLIRIMKSWKPWEHIFGEVDEKEVLVNMMNLRNDNPFPTVSEEYQTARANKPQRKASAAVHPEDSQ